MSLLTHGFCGLMVLVTCGQYGANMLRREGRREGGREKAVEIEGSRICDA